MKKIGYLLFILILLGSCNDLDIEPRNIVNDDVALGTKNGNDAYMAALYAMLPIDDFKSSYSKGYNTWENFDHLDGLTGDLLSDKNRGAKVGASKYWSDGYKIIRAANYLLENIHLYEANFESEYYNYIIGEAYFIRAYTYFALVKRYGGVPLTLQPQNINIDYIELLHLERSPEDVCYDQIKADLDTAIILMHPITERTDLKTARGRANKYVAAAFKSRAMLFAGSIALANDLRNSGMCGIRAERAEGYFREAYEAALFVEKGGYELYRANSDKFQNYVDLFFDLESKENIFIKEYYYPDAVHSYDALYVPAQYVGADGYGKRACPSMEFVEFFDGFPKQPASGMTSSSLDMIVTSDRGFFVQYDNITDLFKDAEPRLKATVLLPGENFKGVPVDFRKGIYVGPLIAGMIQEVNFNSDLYNNRVLRSTDETLNFNNYYKLSDTDSINYSGLSGPFQNQSGTITGFGVRKYLDPNKDVADVRLHRSAQHFIEIRYAEVLLNRAEAAAELYLLGANDRDYFQDAFNCINDIRDRAGANLLEERRDLEGLGRYDTRRVIRVERRKELAFEYKLWWDFKRWRRCLSARDEDADVYMYNTPKSMLAPYYVPATGKYIFHRASPMENSTNYTFNQLWYYEPIPEEQIALNPKLVRNDY